MGIAVEESSRRQGIGTLMLRQVMESCCLQAVFAETDDDAVGFYKKRGFKAHEIETEHNVKRYICKFSSNCT